MKRFALALIIVASSMGLSGCTTCDVALWIGNDVCEIGGY